VGGSIYTSHTLNHLKEHGLDTQKALILPSNNMLILRSVRTN